MAVEIKRHHSKRLYRHAAPIFITSAFLLALSAFGLHSYKQLKPIDDSQFAKAFVQPFLHVKHLSNGLAQVRVAEPKAEVQTDQKQTLNNVSIKTAGDSVNRSVSLQTNFK